MAEFLGSSTDFYFWQGCNLHRQRLCFCGCHGSCETVAVKRVSGQRPSVEHPFVELLLETLRTHQGSIKFVKVPSHVNMIGNNETDRLADQGRLFHPLCPVFQTPEGHASADQSPPHPHPLNDGGECRVRTFNQSRENCSFPLQKMSSLANRNIFSRIFLCGWVWSCFREIGCLHLSDCSSSDLS